MTFMKGEKCELRVLHNGASRLFAEGVNGGLTTKHMMTGSFPMRDIDFGDVWDKERKAGDVLLGIWVEDSKGDCTHSMAGKCIDCSGRFIGTCGLHDHKEIYRSWELRILIFDETAIGKGVGTEAVDLLTSYCFGKLNANRLWLGVSEDNEGAIACYRKCGFIEEGRLREELFYDNEYHDAVRFSVLRKEYEEMRKV